VARRAAPTDPFDAPEPVSELNTTQADGDAWLTEDGRTVLFASGPITTLDLHIATR
jgi:hypothetical protein